MASGVSKALNAAGWGEKLLLLSAFWPVWAWYIRRATDGSDEPWQLVAAAGSLMFLSTIPGDEDRPFSRPIALSGLTLYILTYSSLPPLVRAAIALSTVTFSAKPIRQIPPAGFLLLLLALPLFSTLDFLLSFPLRRLIAFPALILFHTAGFSVSLSGCSFVWKDSEILIDAPCSGVRMLYASLLLAAFLGTTLRLRWRELGILLFLTLCSAILANVFRSASLFFVEARAFYPDLLSRYEAPLHTGIGLMLFAGSAVAICLGAMQLRTSGEQRP